MSETQRRAFWVELGDRLFEMGMDEYVEVVADLSEIVEADEAMRAAATRMAVVLARVRMKLRA